MALNSTAAVVALATVLVALGGCSSTPCVEGGGRFACDPTAALLGPTREDGAAQEDGETQEQPEVAAQVQPPLPRGLEHAPPPPFWRTRPPVEPVP